MATLINREAWHVGACLSYGKITKHAAHIPAVTIHRGVAFGDIVIHSSQALLSIDAAIKSAQEAADYWEHQVKELIAEKYRRENNVT